MDIQWKDVNVNFNDANSAMTNAQSGISKAGTVFGELRKAILDEEQKAIDNAYRQKVFDENVRQFGLRHALDQDRFTEQVRANQANEANTRRGQDLNYKSSMASVGVQNARLAFDRSKWNTQQEQLKRDREILANIYKGVIEEQNTVNNSIEQLNKELESTIDPAKKAELQNQLNGLKVQRNQLSASALDQTVRTEAAKNGIYLKDTVFTPEATLEQNRLAAARAADVKAGEAAQKNTSETTKIIRDLNLTPGQQELAYKVLIKAKELYPDVPESVLANVLARTPMSNTWLGFGNERKFDYDSILQDFIDGTNLNNNLFNQALVTQSMNFMRNNRKK